MSDESWPELECCACGGEPDPYETSEALFRACCYGEGNEDPCGREVMGNSKAEAGAAWNALQRAARGAARETERRVLGRLWAVVRRDGSWTGAVGDFEEMLRLSNVGNAGRKLYKQGVYRVVGVELIELVTAEAPVEEIDFAPAKRLLADVEKCERITAEDLALRVGSEAPGVTEEIQRVCGSAATQKERPETGWGEAQKESSIRAGVVDPRDRSGRL